MSCNKTPKIIIVLLRKQRLPRLDTQVKLQTQICLTHSHIRELFLKKGEEEEVEGGGEEEEELVAGKGCTLKQSYGKTTFKANETVSF